MKNIILKNDWTSTGNGDVKRFWYCWTGLFITEQYWRRKANYIYTWTEGIGYHPELKRWFFPWKTIHTEVHAMSEVA